MTFLLVFSRSGDTWQMRISPLIIGDEGRMLQSSFLEIQHMHRTSFAPETTLSNRNERDRPVTKMQEDQRN
jgi:hypothetical protein